VTRSRHSSRQLSPERGRLNANRVRLALGAVVLALALCGHAPPAAANGPVPPRLAWGEPDRRDPSALVILLHGGGWKANPNGFEVQAQIAKAVQRWGYATAAVGYSGGVQGLREIVAVYETARRRYPGIPVCAVGDSSGGHLALMLAARKPSLDCAVDRVGPTNLASLAAQGATVAHEAAVDAFGAGGLERFSPVRYAARIEANVLMILAENDPVIPVAQGSELMSVLPSAELVVLPPGQATWFHGSSVTEPALERAKRLPLLFVRKVALGS
jgi:acetyl esterase/lipase